MYPKVSAFLNVEGREEEDLPVEEEAGKNKSFADVTSKGFVLTISK